MKLRGVLAHTASSAAIDGHGNLVVELYDFSAEAHRRLGNDVAFTLKVGAAEKAEAVRRLLAEDHTAHAQEADGDASLLRLVAQRFDDYYDVERWLSDQGIPFRKEFEPWA